MFSVDELRKSYLDFFNEKGCKIVRSSSLVPNDPTLLFTNAGMVQFKNYFSGSEKAEFTRATSAQKCVRAGGKHNDLENVGYTARHHTFFEMLGNFSFGDYFKEEAITWAWEFLTKILKVPSDRLLVTVYHNDNEAYSIWKNKVGLAEERIIKIATSDNFWEMGDTGPCGPCSEIFYDHGSDIAGGIPGSVDEDGDRYIEIWNIVFTQFNRNNAGELENLTSKNIDTGMGLERMAAVLQGVHNNYEIDLFRKLIANSINIIGDGDIFFHRVVVDHLRSSSFLIADGVMPNNEGRGYVLRRIMRRAMLHLYKLGSRNVSMYRLVPQLVDLMGSAYPELSDQEKLIIDTLENEEHKFRETLERGIGLLEQKISKTKGKILSGEDVFELYDTYGFPTDITALLLKDRDMTLDMEGFEMAMARQKERARAHWVGSGDRIVSDDEKLINNICSAIDSPTEFNGYENFTTSARILKIIHNGESVEEAREGDEVEIITDKTCFYAEMGGQAGDGGMMIMTSNNGSIPLPFSVAVIQDTKRSSNGIAIHRGVIEAGIFKVGSPLNMSIDRQRRLKTAANHSATHLLHYALRSILGNGVRQRGSHVDQNSLRFDLSYDGPIDNTSLQKIEEIVNAVIAENTEVKTTITTLEEAKKMGAIALFDEKYGNEVRVVSMGLYEDRGSGKTEEKTPKIAANKDYEIVDVIEELETPSLSYGFRSVELCGGTHVKRTGDMGFFKIIREESVASGVRRIEALTGIEALKFVNSNLSILDDLASNFKTSTVDVSGRIASLLEENRELKKQIAELHRMELDKTVFDKINLEDGVVFYHKTFDDGDVQEIKKLLLTRKNTINGTNSILCALVNNKDKHILLVTLSDDLVEKGYTAAKILEQFSARGGGAAAFAMGSCKAAKIDLEKVNMLK